MMTAPDPQEDWQAPPPRCPVCCFRMPTPAHVFLHQQQHGPGSGLETGRLQRLPMVFYDDIAQLMQEFKEHGMKT